MKFMVDAQLPQRLALWFRYQGFDCLHTIELPQANLTQDEFIRTISTAENRVVITKDTDFLQSFMVKRILAKLLLVTTGNITNNELLAIFSSKKDILLAALQTYDMVELNTNEIIAFEG